MHLATVSLGKDEVEGGSVKEKVLLRNSNRENDACTVIG
jgi:hypothetical protein